MAAVLKGIVTALLECFRYKYRSEIDIKKVCTFVK